MKKTFCITLSAFLGIVAGSNTGLAQLIFRDRGPAPPEPATVQIVTPEDGAVILAPSPTNIEVYAETENFTDKVISVEFLAGTNDLGTATNGVKVPCRVGEPPEFFGINWSNVAPGSYSLTAVATDAAGGSVTSSVVDIQVVTNIPPRVHIGRPHDGAVIVTISNIDVCAFAHDPDGTVADVELFAGTNSLGLETNAPTLETNGLGVFTIQDRRYCFDWNNPAAGSYALTAVATDNAGVSSTSAPVNVTIVSNLPPWIDLLNPLNHSKFYALGDISAIALAGDNGGDVTNVMFFLGTNDEGSAVASAMYTNSFRRIEGFYALTLSNLTAGVQVLTAVAVNNYGESTTSAPVNITILPPPPPSVQIISPGYGEVFFAPAEIHLLSLERYFPDAVASVQYFSGSTSLGVVTNGPGFGLYWTNVTAGKYKLTATATDVSGTNVVTSPPVPITVLPRPRFL